MLLLNLLGVILLACGMLAASWPFVLTVRRPLRWIFSGGAVAVVGFFLIRL